LILSRTEKDNELTKIYCLATRQYEERKKNEMNEDEYLNEKAEEVKNLESTNLLQIGRILIEVKNKLSNHKSGKYGKWIKNLGISREKARVLEHRALLYLRTRNEKLNDIKEVSNLAVAYIARNKKISDREVERIIDDKGVAFEKIREEKIRKANKNEFGRLKIEIEEIKKILTGLEPKGLVDRVRSLTAIEMKLKRFEREVRELKEKTQRKQDEKVSRKMF
jgi:hypothetical protein